jgi:hypothetical protein
VPPKWLAVPGLFGHDDGVSDIRVKARRPRVLRGLACFAFACFNLGPKKTTA